MAKKNKTLNNFIKNNNIKKIKDSELMLKFYEKLYENEDIVWNGVVYDFGGLDLKNLKRLWEI